MPIYSLFLIVSSVILQKSASAPMLVVVGASFIATAYLKRNDLWIRCLSLALLAALHWYSQLNWSNILYLAMLAKAVVDLSGFLRITAAAFLYTLVYSVIRLSYMEPTAYNLLVTGTDFFGAFGLVILIRYLAEAETVKRKWKQSLLEAQAMSRAEKLSAIGELAAGMAHEIRNPLTTVKGFIQVARSDGNLHRYYDMIMDEITRMTELTSEFLQFAKPSAACLKDIPIQSCALRAFQLLESEGLRQGHRIRCECVEEELLVRMDRDKIVQLFINLVKNAFDAMERSGTVTISVRKEGSAAVVTVEDTGKGIPPSEIKRLFDPFYTTKENGTGLGLAISQKIVTDHGGRIDVRSRVGEGTVFTLKFPISTGSAQALQANR